MDDLISWPFALGMIGICLVVYVIRGGSLVDMLKHWAGWIALVAAIAGVRLCVGSLDKRFIEPLDKRIPWLKKIVLIMLLVFLASVVGLAVWALCYLD